MEQSANKERQIVQWKMSTINWSVEGFLETHPKYKKEDSPTGYNLWPMVFTLADQLGIDENTMHDLFDEKPDGKIIDIVFALYLTKLYGAQVWEEFFSYKKTINYGEVHGFIKGHEGLLQNIDPSAEKTEDSETAGKETTDSKNPESDVLPQKELKECLRNLMELIQQHSATQKEYETVIQRLVEKTEKPEVASESSDKNITVFDKKSDAEVSSLWKRIIKSEKENAVLKTQLEAEKREATLKHEAAMEMKRVEMEHLKKQMDIYISSLEELRKENKTLLQENEELKHKTQSIRYEQIQSRLGILHNQKKRKSMKASPMDERQELVMKILSSSEYPDFLKEFIAEAYQNGIDLKRIQTFDNPKLEKSNFEMMKAIVYLD